MVMVTLADLKRTGSEIEACEFENRKQETGNRKQETEN
jgi:hypothetical protein